VLRALARSPQPADALLAEVGLAAGAGPRLDQAIGLLRQAVGEARAPGGGEAAGTLAGREAEFRARRLAGLIAVTLQAALLARHAPAAVAGAFCASRLDTAGSGGPAGPGLPFGMLPAGLDLPAILDRCKPEPGR
ncbi:MAG: DNA alkylation response protein, partial [Actinomycetota bacterium]